MEYSLESKQHFCPMVSDVWKKEMLLATILFRSAFFANLFYDPMFEACFCIQTVLFRYGVLVSIRHESEFGDRYFLWKSIGVLGSLAVDYWVNFI